MAAERASQVNNLLDTTGVLLFFLMFASNAIVNMVPCDMQKLLFNPWAQVIMSFVVIYFNIVLNLDSTANQSFFKSGIKAAILTVFVVLLTKTSMPFILLILALLFFTIALNKYIDVRYTEADMSEDERAMLENLNMYFTSSIFILAGFGSVYYILLAPVVRKCYVN